MNRRLTIPPAKMLFLLVLIDMLAVALAVGSGVALHGDPSAYTGEGEPITWLSFAHLVAIGMLAGGVFYLRTDGHFFIHAWRDPRWIWPIIALGFLFLAVDEVVRLHESLDHALHRAFQIQETGLSDRLDDTIVLGYAVLGVSVLYAYRSELTGYRAVLPLLGCGFLLFVFMVLLDALTNDDDVLRLAGIPSPGIEILGDWLGSIEEALKICAEAALLGTVYACFCMTIERHRTSATDETGHGGRHPASHD